MRLVTRRSERNDGLMDRTHLERAQLEIHSKLNLLVKEH